MARSTFDLVTDESIHGVHDLIELKANKLPALRHGMEQWEIQYLRNGEVLNKHIVKCTKGLGAMEARAILHESAPYWNRKVKEDLPNQDVKTVLCGDRVAKY